MQPISRFVSDVSLDPEYLHLPNIQTLDGLLDLLSASILVILRNVLDFRTYSAPDQHRDEEALLSQQLLMTKFDCNNIPSNERQTICHAWGVALTIFNWVRKHCTIRDANRKVLQDLPSHCLVQILNALLNYKAKAIQADLQGAPHCDMDMLKAQVENVLKCDTLAEKVWENRQHMHADSLTFEPKEDHSIKWAAPCNDGKQGRSYWALESTLLTNSPTPSAVPSYAWTGKGSLLRSHAILRLSVPCYNHKKFRKLSSTCNLHQ